MVILACRSVLLWGHLCVMILVATRCQCGISPGCQNENRGPQFVSQKRKSWSRRLARLTCFLARAVVSVHRLPFQLVFPVQFSIGSHLIRRLFLVLSPNVDTFLPPTSAQITSEIPPFWCYLSTLKHLQEDISNSTVFPHSNEGF